MTIIATNEPQWLSFEDGIKMLNYIKSNRWKIMGNFGWEYKYINIVFDSRTGAMCFGDRDKKTYLNVTVVGKTED